MAILAMDLGGTKLSSAIFSSLGEIITKEVVPVNGMKGSEVGKMITTAVQRQLGHHAIESIGISVPGISRHKTGTVWAPNIEGWEDYPLANEVQGIAGQRPVGIDDDRACSIFGEQWQGHAKGCKDVVFLAIGTGIGAGILSGGNLIRGSQDVAGAIGWWALQKPFVEKYSNCGCFEYYASGGGIPKLTNEYLQRDSAPSVLRNIHSTDITAHQVFDAYDKGDRVAVMIIQECITYWGMSAANLVSILNPEKIIFGGGVFGPASRFIDAIKVEASKWAQPVSMRQVSFERSALGPDAALFGAANMALRKLSNNA